MARTSSVLCVLLSLFVAGSAYAYSAMISIEDLIKKSEVIVVARVSAVRAGQDENVKIATAEVEATWKSKDPGPVIEYVSSPGWFACDTSDARVGERVVLFLERDASDGRLHIANFGRGRMHIVGKGRYAQLRTYEVIFNAMVDLGALEAMVSRITHAGTS